MKARLRETRRPDLRLGINVIDDGIVEHDQSDVVGCFVSDGRMGFDKEEGRKEGRKEGREEGSRGAKNIFLSVIPV